MVLVYANQIEIRHINATITKICIGLGAKNLHVLDNYHPDKVLLFGSCGDLGRHETNIFYTDIKKIISTPYTVHEKERRIFSSDEFDVCDMETDLVYDYCHARDIEFKIYRYIIDRCDRRVMPWGINHFWRDWQHYKMQTKFDQMLIKGEI